MTQLELKGHRVHKYETGEFLSVSWASHECKSIWEPRCDAIVDALLNIELISVQMQVRDCALQWISSASLVQYAAITSGMLLKFIVVGKQIVGESGYQSRALPNGHSVHELLCVAAGRSQRSLVRLRLAIEGRDDLTIGSYLGYPECCVRSFNSYWREDIMDPTWHAVSGASCAESGQRQVDERFSPLSNLALRWIGIRSCFHLPCSFNCESTVAVAESISVVADAAGYSVEWKWIREALGWRFHWSSLRGIGEVVTPVCRFAFSSDFSAAKRSILFSSGRFPAEAPSGSKFPFPSRSERSESLNGRVEFAPSQSRASLNGFDSLARMRLSHSVMVKDLVSVFGADSGLTIADLGCGDGELLARLKRRAPHWLAIGVECAEEMLLRAARKREEGIFEIVAGDIFEASSQWLQLHPDVVLIAAARLIEISTVIREEFLRRMNLSKILIIVYSYDISGGVLGDRLMQLGLESVGLTERLYILRLADSPQ